MSQLHFHPPAWEQYPIGLSASKYPGKAELQDSVCLQRPPFHLAGTSAGFLQPLPQDSKKALGSYFTEDRKSLQPRGLRLLPTAPHRSHVPINWMWLSPKASRRDPCPATPGLSPLFFSLNPGTLSPSLPEAIIGSPFLLRWGPARPSSLPQKQLQLSSLPALLCSPDTAQAFR